MKYVFGLDLTYTRLANDDPVALRQGTPMNYNVTKLNLKAPSLSSGEDLRYFRSDPKRLSWATF